MSLLNEWKPLREHYDFEKVFEDVFEVFFLWEILAQIEEEVNLCDCWEVFRVLVLGETDMLQKLNNTLIQGSIFVSFFQFPIL